MILVRARTTTCSYQARVLLLLNWFPSAAAKSLAEARQPSRPLDRVRLPPRRPKPKKSTAVYSPEKTLTISRQNLTYDTLLREVDSYGTRNQKIELACISVFHMVQIRLLRFVFSHIVVFRVSMPGFRLSWEGVGRRSYRNN